MREGGAVDNRPILIFNGTGASRNDVVAIGNILKENGFACDTADSNELNSIGKSDLAKRRLLIVPGGNYLVMGQHLTKETTQRVRNAVCRGLNYLGICAGGLLAGRADCNSFNLTSGVKFGFYSVVNRGIHKTVAPISWFGLPVTEHYWEDGPQFTGWGLVLGKYPDGTPAVVEDTCGKGYVLLCGVHPEAPESWRRGMNFTTPARVSKDDATKLISAALNGALLPHY